MSPEEAVRKFFDCYTDGRPEDFDECVAPDYVNYGHEPPGIGHGTRSTATYPGKCVGAVTGESRHSPFGS